MERDSDVVTAWAIGEWSTALSHLGALDQMGLSVPHSVIDRVQRELHELCWLWLARRGVITIKTGDVEWAVADARNFCTEHVAEIDELLRRKKEGT